MSNRPTNPQALAEANWRKTFNELCYAVFYKNKVGAALLAHMENKFFRSPVAYPNREPAWAYFNEGQNELIRSFTVAIQQHLIEAEPASAAPVKRKSKIKPV